MHDNDDARKICLGTHAVYLSIAAAYVCRTEGLSCCFAVGIIIYRDSDTVLAATCGVRSVWISVVCGRDIVNKKDEKQNKKTKSGK